MGLGVAVAAVAGERLAGTLLGTALGDALGLPAERMSPAAIRRRFGRMDEFHLLGRWGFVGAGLATARACLRIALGLSRSGVPSAGNGAAMRSAIVGAFFDEEGERRRRSAAALAQVTHTDPRAAQGALFVAEVAAASSAQAAEPSPERAVEAAMPVVGEASLLGALETARALAAPGAETTEAAAALGTSGFVVQTVPFATFRFLTAGRDPLAAIVRAVSAGGDTDSIGAIVGAWVGALHGAAGLPAGLVSRIQDGPFGPTHLRALGRWLSTVRQGERAEGVGFSALAAFARNLALRPVILGHGFRRLLPF